MPTMMAPGKFHGGMTAPTPSGNVVEIVFFAGIIDDGLALVQAHHFAAIELEEVDGFGGVAVGFHPVLADFHDHGGAEFVLAAAQNGGGAEQDAGAGIGIDELPPLEGLVGVLNGLEGQFLRAFADVGQHLIGIGGIGGLDGVVGEDAFAADDERDFFAETTFDQRQRLFEGGFIGGIGEIRHRLVFEGRKHRQSLLRFNVCGGVPPWVGLRVAIRPQSKGGGYELRKNT